MFLYCSVRRSATRSPDRPQLKPRSRHVFTAALHRGYGGHQGHNDHSAKSMCGTLSISRFRADAVQPPYVPLSVLKAWPTRT